jgi:hypothetical protein
MDHLPQDASYALPMDRFLGAVLNNSEAAWSPSEVAVLLCLTSRGFGVSQERSPSAAEAHLRPWRLGTAD